MNPLYTYKEKDKALFNAVRAFKAGDDSKANLIYELSEKYIYSCIHQIEKNQTNIEDMMQETYLQVFNKMDTLEDAEKFLVWAGRIATNRTLRFLQKYKKECLVTADEEGETDFVFDMAAEDREAFIPETVLDNKETQRLIADIVDGLSPAQKLCVQYFYYDEMSVNDIAKTMNCSVGTVKSRLNYARKSIKEAVVDLDVKQGTRLYSLASMPLFLLVFRAGVEDLAAGAIAGALGVGAVSGTIGGGSSAAGVLGGASAAEGTGVLGGASAGATAAGGSTAAGGAAAGIGAKIFGTAAGKAVVGVLAAALVGGGAYVATQMSAEPVQQEIVAETTVEETEEPVTEETAGEETEEPVTEETAGEETEEPVTEETAGENSYEFASNPPDESDMGRMINFTYIKTLSEVPDYPNCPVYYKSTCDVGYINEAYLMEEKYGPPMAGGRGEYSEYSLGVAGMNAEVPVQNLSECVVEENVIVMSESGENLWLTNTLAGTGYLENLMNQTSEEKFWVSEPIAYETKVGEYKESEQAIGLSDISAFPAELSIIEIEGNVYQIADIVSVGLIESNHPSMHTATCSIVACYMPVE